MASREGRPSSYPTYSILLRSPQVTKDVARLEGFPSVGPRYKIEHLGGKNWYGLHTQIYAADEMSVSNQLSDTAIYP